MIYNAILRYLNLYVYIGHVTLCLPRCWCHTQSLAKQGLHRWAATPSSLLLFCETESFCVTQVTSSRDPSASASPVLGLPSLALLLFLKPFEVNSEYLTKDFANLEELSFLEIPGFRSSSSTFYMVSFLPLWCRLHCSNGNFVRVGNLFLLTWR